MVGLGNPGSEYRDTRHNVGQRVLDAPGPRRPFATQPWRRDGGWAACAGRWRGETVTLVKPLRLHERVRPGGRAGAARLGAEPDDLILVYDDIDLPLGTVRVRMKGSAGGHNGVRSVIEALGTDRHPARQGGRGSPGAQGATSPTTC